MKEATHGLYRLLQFLDEIRLHYRLDRHRPDTVRVTVFVVGERTEIDVFDDGHLEITRFTGDESVESGDEAVEALFRQLREEAK